MSHVTFYLRAGSIAIGACATGIYGTLFVPVYLRSIVGIEDVLSRHHHKKSTQRFGTMIGDESMEGQRRLVGDGGEEGLKG